MRQTHLGQRTGETEAMHQPRGQNNHPGIFFSEGDVTLTLSPGFFNCKDGGAWILQII